MKISSSVLTVYKNSKFRIYLSSPFLAGNDRNDSGNNFQVSAGPARTPPWAPLPPSSHSLATSGTTATLRTNFKRFQPIKTPGEFFKIFFVIFPFLACMPTWRPSFCSFLEFVHHAGPIFEDEALATAADQVPVLLRLFNATVVVFNKTSIVKFLENKSGFPDFFVETEALERYLTVTTKSLTPEQGDLLINRSKFNATTLVLVTVISTIKLSTGLKKIRGLFT